MQREAGQLPCLEGVLVGMSEGGAWGPCNGSVRTRSAGQPCAERIQATQLLPGQATLWPWSPRGMTWVLSPIQPACQGCERATRSSCMLMPQLAPAQQHRKGPGGPPAVEFPGFAPMLTF